MPYCPQCGTQNDDSAKFCDNCGAALTVASSVPLPLTGSRVSFVAGDGKTYTGTIKEINGDQYKIRYDAFNFETWLKRNQFTVVPGGTTPPAYTPSTQQPVTQPASGPSRPVHHSSPLFITHLGFWGSLMIIIGFFTDWIKLANGMGITGFKILSSARGILNDTDNDKSLLYMLIAIGVILLSAIICLFYTVSGIGKGAFMLFKIIPLLAIIAFVAYIMVQLKEATGSFNVEVDASIWDVLGVGIYLTLVGSFVLAISRFRK